MRVFICVDCHDGFDIDVSGGIECPECGGRKWKSITRLPAKAEKYRMIWAEKYDIMICDDKEDAERRQIDWEADK
tara:strand:+ start:249 stop:473 length:225 start_codon:yes stop_codon:yes gene_type:complete